MNIKQITSAANPSVKSLRALQVKKYRDEEKLFIVEGLRHIDDALKGGFDLYTLVLTPDARKYPAAAEVMAAAEKSGAEILEMDIDLISRITNRDNAQDIMAVMRQRQTKLDEAKRGLWIGLENIRDPGNLGTIMRTADAVAAKGVILCENGCDPWSPECIRATMGSFARIAVAASSTADFIRWKKDHNALVIGTHLSGAQDYRREKYAKDMILMMGSESHGLSPEMTAACDRLVKIPMPGGTESLNLAVSTGIMLYEICRDKV